jgi:hypothetical protein
MPTSAVSPLEFYYRSDGHCGAGAPRYNLVVENGGIRQTFFFGCNSGMAPTKPSLVDDQGRTWFHRSTIGPLPPGTVVRLAIVYDEGNDLGFPCPDPGNSCTFLDNIGVGGHIWTSASDNGQSESSTANSLTLEQLWGAPLETLLTG